MSELVCLYLMFPKLWFLGAGGVMRNLNGKRIVVGITGGIAAYKTIEFIRLLRKSNAEVRVVLTAAAAEFVTPLTLQAISGNPV